MIAIHIGSNKAGSTTIQKFLDNNTDALHRLGVDYPLIGQTNRGYHANLYYEVRRHRNFDPKYGTLSELIDHVRADRFGTTIISAEEFHRCAPAEVARLKHMLDEIAESIQIVLVIREFIEFMPSNYSQSTKNGENSLDFDTLFLKRVKRCGKGLTDTAQAWGNAFGWDRLRIRVLDRRLLLNGDLIDDFLNVVGVDPSGSDFKRAKSTGFANASPGWRVLEAVRALYSGDHALPAEHVLSQCVAHSQTERKLIGRRARELGGELGWNADRGRYLSRSQAQQCVDIHREAIATLNKVLPDALPLPLDLTTRGFIEREFMPHASQIPAEELRDFYDKLAARISRKRPADVTV